METVKKFISTFIIAVSNCSLYSKGHSSVDEYARKCLSILSEILTDTLEIMIVEDDLIINKAPLKDSGIHGTNFIRRFKRKGISRVDFLKGVTLAELKQLIIDISETGKKLKTYPHIKTGVVHVLTSGVKLGADLAIDSQTSLSSEQIEKVKDIYNNISPFKKLNVTGLEEIVVNFIIAFRKEANILKLISPVKSYSEYTYTHATNVSVLSMFQAESLGVNDEMLYNIGLAALMHDVGKLLISKDTLEKKGALNKKEWAEIQQHPLQGTKYLAKIENISRIAPIVAFEHHLRYDGKGYPEINRNGKKQHLYSQIVAVSDFFDALRSKRPYRKSLETKEVIVLMKESSGTFLNEFLVDNFTKILLTSKPH